MVRRARTDYLAGKFDDVSIEYLPKAAQQLKVGLPRGPRPKFEHVEAELDSWVQHVGRRQTGRLSVVRKALELDPHFFDHDQLDARDLKACTAWHAKVGSWFYRRWKKRKAYSLVCIASAGRRMPEDSLELWDAFAERCLAARQLPDGGLISVANVSVSDQTPVTREIVARKTLRKTGGQIRAKIATAGKEKERWTLDPIFYGDGRMGEVWATATFHGARPQRGKRLAKNTIALELQDWQRHHYPPNFRYSCNKTAYFKEEEAWTLMRALRRKFRSEPGVHVWDDYKVVLPRSTPTLPICHPSANMSRNSTTCLSPTTWPLRHMTSLQQVHKMQVVRQGMNSFNVRDVLVDGGMTPLCNPGDRFINKLIKFGVRTR